jgi:hypothetical protein
MFDSLDERQKRITRLIAKAPNVWCERIGDYEKQSTKASLVLRSCGLPDKQNDLLRYIGKPASAALPPPPPAKESGFSAILNRLFKNDNKS